METHLINDVVQNQDPNIRHDSIPTAGHQVPPISSNHLAFFSECLAALERENQDNLLRSIAGEALIWDPVEVVNVGHRRQKELVIPLADAVWERRALSWLASVRILDSLL
jgi:hypothetical protein